MLALVLAGVLVLVGILALCCLRKCFRRSGNQIVPEVEEPGAELSRETRLEGLTCRESLTEDSKKKGEDAPCIVHSDWCEWSLVPDLCESEAPSDFDRPDDALPEMSAGPLFVQGRNY